MQLINEAELKLETIRHEVEVAPDAFSDSKLDFIHSSGVAERVCQAF